MPKQRLDALLLERYPQYTRSQLQSWVMQGLVFVDGVPVTKPGTSISDTVQLELHLVQEQYVSRAGTKLAAALEHFGVDPTGLVVLDAGLSTGGFTDCLLQKGAKLVYGVDVGYGQVHEKIRRDPRVVVMERTNLRHLTQLPELVDLVTLDLSFISILKVIAAVTPLLKPEGRLLTLIKPQFEAGRDAIERGGLVRNPAVHAQVIADVVAGVEAAGFVHQGTIDSPIEGATGNKEFLALFVKK